MLTEWLSAQHSGFMVLDNDHKRIDILVNESLALLERPDNALLVSKRMREMLFLLEHHFGVERFLMRVSAYPLYDAHNRGHNKILTEFEAMLNISGFNGKCLRQVVAFVRDAITAHRDVIDGEFEDFLRSMPETTRQAYCRKTLERAVISGCAV